MKYVKNTKPDIILWKGAPVYSPGSEGPQIAAQPAVYHWSSCGNRGALQVVSSAWKPLCYYDRKPALEAAAGCTHSGWQSDASHGGRGFAQSRRGHPETQEQNNMRMKITYVFNGGVVSLNYCIVIKMQEIQLCFFETCRKI